jgi:hypothetical protein
LTVSVSDEDYSNLLTVSVSDEGYIGYAHSQKIGITFIGYAKSTYCNNLHLLRSVKMLE